jgi:S-DNA-T family DNA segregation ATPase FtsK/SpoIIIE
VASDDEDEYEDEDEDEQEAAAPPVREAVGAIDIQVPSVTLLDETDASQQDREQMLQEHRARVRQIDETLANFKLGGRVVAAVRGPTVTRFEVEPAPGEKISRFANLSDDLALAMAVGSVRIEAPIPGKSVIGLEVPNAHRELVRFREAVEAPTFKRAKARLPLILGKSIDGEMVVGDLARMPHLLIAGSTGSGKSVAVNALIASLLFRFLPTELRFLMIDPKMVELTPFDGVPHLLRPVVTNPKDAAGVLIGAVSHMERRYQMMSKIGAKNLDQYNEKARNLDLPPMPFIVIVIDELADLMITSPKEVESSIMRLAQMARATGMHLILATQRPSVDILTSLIKVNVPARMAFAVSSSHDSRTILDGMGAERLIGLGDMLFYQPGLVKAVRLQGPFVSENEIVRLADFLRRQYFDDDFVEAYGADFDPPPADESTASGLIDWNDDKLRAAAELVISEGQASVSRLQRRLSVGHARAGKLMDSLEALGVVGPHTGSKPREVLVTMDELPNIFGK